MRDRYQVIDEVNYNILGTFESRGEAVEFVATLLSVNEDSYLDELTIARDEHVKLTGDSLREALRRRAAACARVGSTGGGGTHGSGDSGHGHGSMAAKGYE